MSVPTDICFICRELMDEDDTVVVKERGINTFIQASERRKLRENKRLLQGLKEVKVHISCGKRYSDEKLILASIRRGGDSIPQPSVSCRSSSENFNFK